MPSSQGQVYRRFDFTTLQELQPSQSEMVRFILLPSPELYLANPLILQPQHLQRSTTEKRPQGLPCKGHFRAQRTPASDGGCFKAQATVRLHQPPALASFLTRAKLLATKAHQHMRRLLLRQCLSHPAYSQSTEVPENTRRHAPQCRSV